MVLTRERTVSIVRPCLCLCLLLLGGCKGRQLHEVQQIPVQHSEGVVFVLDGAGGYHTLAYALAYTTIETRMPVLVQPVVWSHGEGYHLRDQIDNRHTEMQGERLAQQVLAWKRQFPDKPVYLVGYSAGSAPILLAGNYLPPDSVERIVLLAPAVSEKADLRPALRCARQGVNAFASKRDRLFLNAITRIVGTTDGVHGPAAGLHGFQVQAETIEDATLYNKFHQHHWDPSVNWTGNTGRHYGAHQPEFLKAYILPLLSCSPH